MDDNPSKRCRLSEDLNNDQLVDLTEEDGDDNREYSYAYESDNDILDIKVPTEQLIKRIKVILRTLTHFKINYNAKSLKSSKSHHASHSKSFSSGVGYGGDNSKPISSNQDVKAAKSKLSGDDMQLRIIFREIASIILDNTSIDSTIIHEIFKSKQNILWSMIILLRNDSITDICERKELYEALLEIMKSFTVNYFDYITMLSDTQYKLPDDFLIDIKSSINDKNDDYNIINKYVEDEDQDDDVIFISTTSTTSILNNNPSKSTNTNTNTNTTTTNTTTNNNNSTNNGDITIASNTNNSTKSTTTSTNTATTKNNSTTTTAATPTTATTTTTATTQDNLLSWNDCMTAFEILQRQAEYFKKLQKNSGKVVDEEFMDTLSLVDDLTSTYKLLVRKTEKARASTSSSAAIVDDNKNTIHNNNVTTNQTSSTNTTILSTLINTMSSFTTSSSSSSSSSSSAAAAASEASSSHKKSKSSSTDIVTSTCTSISEDRIRREQEYIAQLRPLQFDTVSILDALLEEEDDDKNSVTTTTNTKVKTTTSTNKQTTKGYKYSYCFRIYNSSTTNHAVSGTSFHNNILNASPNIFGNTSITNAATTNTFNSLFGATTTTTTTTATIKKPSTKAITNIISGNTSNSISSSSSSSSSKANSNTTTHYFTNTATSAGVVGVGSGGGGGVAISGISMDPKRASRLLKEITTLSTSLPLEYGSSVFLRCDEDRFDVLKALIIGPVDTPYENGCFEFDIFLPPNYPQVPPKVQFLTTGNGAVRFNPNLYNCGKVCLSLLGTWAGPSWDPKSSTLLQVFISLQALILVPDPYFNEPGWESSRNTPRGKSESTKYNHNIQKYTILYAIQEQLNQALNHKKTCLFADVIKTHFKCKKIDILHQLDTWQTQLDSWKTSKTTVNIIKGYLNQL